MVNCPGHDQRFWKVDDIFEVNCPKCGKAVEFFKDEPQVKCRNCGRIVINPKIDLGCAEWCQYAEQCVAASATNTTSFIRDTLIDEMKKVFAGDQKRIDHALAVLDYAEKIQAAEGGDPLILKAAAILHDIGIHEAERKYSSSAAKYQETEGPIIARAILANYDLDRAVVEHICKIIANHHSAKGINTLEFRCVWDADWLVNMSAQFERDQPADLDGAINRIFKTHKGRQIAMALFVNRRDNQNKQETGEKGG